MATLLAKRVRAAMPDSGSVWRSKEPQSRAFKDYYLPFRVREQE